MNRLSSVVRDYESDANSCSIYPSFSLYTCLRSSILSHNVRGNFIVIRSTVIPSRFQKSKTRRSRAPSRLRLISALNRVRRALRRQTYETRNSKYRCENYNRLRENRLPASVPRLTAGDRDKKKNHQAVPKRPPDKGQNSSKTAAAGRSRRERRRGGSERKKDRERERGGNGWRRGEEIHYHKAGNFTRIMSELRIPRDSPRCCLSLSKFRHNGHTSTT